MSKKLKLTILVVDDDLLHRLVLGTVLSARSGVLLADSPDMLDWITVVDLGLVIVDRYLPCRWEEAWEKLLARINSLPEGHRPILVEMSRLVDLSGVAPPRPNSRRSIVKTGTGREVLKAIDLWLQTGDVVERQAVECVA